MPISWVPLALVLHFDHLGQNHHYCQYPRSLVEQFYGRNQVQHLAMSMLDRFHMNSSQVHMVSSQCHTYEDYCLFPHPPHITRLILCARISSPPIQTHPRLAGLHSAYFPICHPMTRPIARLGLASDTSVEDYSLSLHTVFHTTFLRLSLEPSQSSVSIVTVSSCHLHRGNKCG
ncbi:unnamed protein product [Somion occarium]|uniref:Secreted protein n=1 Tax=Somion occarium TaxID=3059160 RepID=A0ABP1DKD1_9APHY